MNEQLRERFAGIDRLYGRGTIERLAQCRVAVVGMGGVGSWVVEALARSAVGHLTLIDADDICVSNTNRQLPALQGQYGRNKARAMAERCVAINPATRPRVPVARVRPKVPHRPTDTKLPIMKTSPWAKLISSMIP
jgi:tRNA A37 threonylcarbamoyladenosine dehydratase